MAYLGDQALSWYGSSLAGLDGFGGGFEDPDDVPRWL
jgi:hypothetical protein